MAGIKDTTIHPGYVAISEWIYWLILYDQLVQTKFGSNTCILVMFHRYDKCIASNRHSQPCLQAVARQPTA